MTRRIGTPTSASAWLASINEPSIASGTTSVAPAAGLIVRMVAAVVGGYAFLALGGTEPPPRPLSAREVDILRLVAEVHTNKEIGDLVDLSALTVKSHLARIARKLGTGDRAHMVALALRSGVIS